MKNGQREWLRLRGRGVHHYYVQNLVGLCAKTAAGDRAFSPRAGRDARELDEGKTAGAVVAGGGLLRQFFRPAVAHAAGKFSGDGDVRWLWHLPACPASVLGNAWGVLTYKAAWSGQKAHRRPAGEAEV